MPRLTAESLRSSLTKALPCMYSGSHRPAIHGVHLDWNGQDTLHAVAIDGPTLAAARVTAQPAGDDDTAWAYTVPGSQIPMLLALLSEDDDSDVTVTAVQDGDVPAQVIVTTDIAAATVTAVTGPFANWRGVLATVLSDAPDTYQALDTSNLARWQHGSAMPGVFTTPTGELVFVDEDFIGLQKWANLREDRRALLAKSWQDPGGAAAQTLEQAVAAASAMDPDHPFSKVEANLLQTFLTSHDAPHVDETEVRLIETTTTAALNALLAYRLLQELQSINPGLGVQVVADVQNMLQRGDADEYAIAAAEAAGHDVDEWHHAALQRRDDLLEREAERRATHAALISTAAQQTSTADTSTPDRTPGT